MIIKRKTYVSLLIFRLPIWFDMESGVFRIYNELSINYACLTVTTSIQLVQGRGRNLSLRKYGKEYALPHQSAKWITALPEEMKRDVPGIY